MLFSPFPIFHDLLACISELSIDRIDVDSTVTRYWHKAGRAKSGYNIGVKCHYCTRVYEARYKSEFPVYDNFLEAMGKDADLFNTVRGLGKKYEQKCLTLFQESGPSALKKIRMDWNLAENELRLEVVRQETVGIDEPDDDLIPLNEYKGDHKLNGHSTMEIGGNTFVRVPTSTWKKLKRGSRTHVNLTKQIGDNKLSVGDDDLNRLQSATVKQLGFGNATGAISPFGLGQKNNDPPPFLDPPSPLTLC